MRRLRFLYQREAFGYSAYPAIGQPQRVDRGVPSRSLKRMPHLDTPFEVARRISVLALQKPNVAELVGRRTEAIRLIGIHGDLKSCCGVGKRIGKSAQAAQGNAQCRSREARDGPRLAEALVDPLGGNQRDRGLAQSDCLWEAARGHVGDAEIAERSGPDPRITECFAD